MLPAVMRGLACPAVGELWSDVPGTGDSMARFSAFEVDRLRCMTKAARASQSLNERARAREHRERARARPLLPGPAVD